ncbi:MAG: hypothetical protein ABIG66_03210 [Candidatus Kerfeldbacteria bacterium]
MKLSRQPGQERRLKATEVLGIPEQKAETFTFNPDTEITEEDWKRVRKYAEKRNNPKTLGHCGEFAHIIDPGRAHDFGVSDDFWKTIGPLLRFREEKAPATQEKVMQMLLLDQTRKDDLEFEYWCSGEKMQPLLEADLEKLPTTNEVIEHLAVRMLARFTLPERKQRSLSTGEKKRILGLINETREKGSYLMFAQVVTPFLLIQPEMRGAIAMTDSDWGGLLEALEARRKGEPELFMRLAECLAVLSADDASISPAGKLMLTRKKPLEGRQPLPERQAV